jgi:hypothetical protein
LEPGDFLAVHDWGQEIRAEDIPPEFEPLLLRECEQVSRKTRFFRRARSIARE